MVFEIIGDEQNSGAIQQLETELQKPLKNKSNLAVAILQDVSDSINNGLIELTKKQQQLSSFSQQLSFKTLYEAVIQLQQSNPETCPACKTPLTRVAVNPYIHANEELQKLHHLSVLQDEIQQQQ
jgi:hypothetical protein